MPTLIYGAISLTTILQVRFIDDLIPDIGYFLNTMIPNYEDIRAFVNQKR